MAVEAPGPISGLNPNWPQDGDEVREGAESIRVVKQSLQIQFPNLDAAVPRTPSEMNALAGSAEGNPLQAQIDQLSAAISAIQLIPVGTMLFYGGAVAPVGYVLCDGALYDGTDPTYSALWAILGNAFGGTGQTSFAVPDLRFRAPLGTGPQDGIGGSVPRGTKYGNQIVSLALNNLPNITSWNPASTKTVIGADSITTQVPNNITTNIGGSSVPFEVVQPVLSSNFIIKL